MICSYNLKKDIRFICEMTGIDIEDLAKEISMSKRMIMYSASGSPTNTTLEKIYGYIYRKGYLLSSAKSEIFKEILSTDESLFFHGSRFGIKEINCTGSRSSSDFSNGFYCSQCLDSASSFVADSKNSSVYVFKAELSGLKCLRFECDLDWMLAISYFRGKLSRYREESYIQSMIQKVEEADMIIAPIADNRMFEVLNQFASGEITTVQAIHSLSASRLGNQYVFKADKAIRKLCFLDRFYLCDEERNNLKNISRDNENIIQTKLKLSEREFRNQGKFIDELFI